MPSFTSPQSPTALSSGEKLAVLNNEALAADALTMAVALTAQPVLVTLAVYNNSGESVTLCASPDMTAADFLPVYDHEGAVITLATATVTMLEVASGLYYAVKAGAAIAGGTIWLAR